MSIYPDYLKGLSTPDTDLNACFSVRNLPSPHRTALSDEEQKRFIYFIHRLVSASGYGADIVERSVFAE